MAPELRSEALVDLASGPARAMREGEVQDPTEFGAIPSGFRSETIVADGTSMHCVWGGSGPAVILVHGFPENWAEYSAIMPRLARHYTVVAVDLPGIGASGPAANGYDTPHMAAAIRDVADALKLERPYIVGHDLGGITTYAYVRSFPNALRGAMIIDVPMAGLPGSENAGSGFWHVGFMQAPKRLAETLVADRQAAFLGWFYDLGRFSDAERAYFIRAYGAPQLHAAFEIYRAFPSVAQWNAQQSAPCGVPLVVAVGENSFFAPHQQSFVDGYRAMGMTHVESAVIPNASHYVVADNPSGVTEVIERYAAK